METNIVFFEADGAESLAQRLDREGVSVGVYGPSTLRAVTHLDVSAEDIDAAIRLVGRVMNA